MKNAVKTRTKPKKWPKARDSEDHLTESAHEIVHNAVLENQGEASQDGTESKEQ